MIDGRKINCAVVNGVRYIDGKTVDEFLKTCNPDEVALLVSIGKRALAKERTSHAK